MPRGLSVAICIVLLAACASSPAPSGSPATTARPTGAGTVSRIEVTPASVLLTEVGAVRQLTVHAYDSTGAEVGTGITWSSSRESVARVGFAGLVTTAGLGTTQIVAEADGVRSAPVLVAVAELGAGVAPVNDEQVVGEPVDSDPGGPPAADATYIVTMSGPPPAVGALLVGTGERAVAGRVVAVEPDGANSAVTMQLVPLEQLLPGLTIEETINLADAPVSVPPEVSRLYDVTRTGNRFDFAPKPNFDELVQGSLPSPVNPLAAVGGEFAQAVGTAALPPFTECEGEFSTLPISLAGAPSFSVEVEPTLDYQRTPAGGFGHWIVRATPKATVEAGFKFEASFEGKYECKAELFVFRIPVSGPLSFFLGGLVPVGVGFELSGKVTLASFGISSNVEAEATASLGLACASGSCGVERSLGGFKIKYKPDVDAPSLGDIRLEPALEVFAFAEADIGNPFLSRLRFEAVEAKVGGKLAADWAPRRVQILDDEYKSSYSLSLEASAKVGPDLGEIGELLGLELTWAELEISNELATSPTGTVSADQQNYQTGDEGHVTVTLAEEGLTFLTLDNVDEVLLVRYSGGTETILGRAEQANDGDNTFDFDFTADGPISADELYGFVVTIVPPLELLALEVGKAGAPATAPPTPTPLVTGGNWHGVFTFEGQTSPIEFDVTLAERQTPSKTSLAGDIQFPNFNIGGIPFFNATGTLDVEVFGDQVNVRRFEFRNGPNMAPCGGQFGGRGTVDPTGEMMDLTLDGSNTCGGAAFDARLVLTQNH